MFLTKAWVCGRVCSRARGRKAGDVSYLREVGFEFELLGGFVRGEV